MDVDPLRELSRHCSSLAEWIAQKAEDLETGMDRHFRGEADTSDSLAADLRHRANNIRALLLGLERIAAKDRGCEGLRSALIGR
jgi:hypothetical protein